MLWLRYFLFKDFFIWDFSYIAGFGKPMQPFFCLRASMKGLKVFALYYEKEKSRLRKSKHEQSIS